MHKILFAAWLALSAVTANADATKYKQANGKILITNQAPSEGSTMVKQHKDEYISADQRQAAQNDVLRQRAFVEAKEQERGRTPTYTSTPASRQNGKAISEIHACLMKVTGTPNSSPYSEASRKVDCYSGSNGLNDDCQRSVGATMGLNTREEQNLRARCPQ